ncbi:MAG: toxin TcdB middle/N-terminal domain-containing protein, partial [Deltaproteobacteria bacterium]|nr:toxin TcdB middle/N-terminal domain-containing protein [Deltaproteobacteria bacterium]
MCLALSLLVAFPPTPSQAAVDPTDGSTVIQARGGTGAPGVASSSVASSDPFTGAATARLPIAAPQGAGGVQPPVAIGYSSQQGNGWIGVGWGYGAGTIQRSLREGVPGYGASDTFQLDGEDLLLDNQSPATYHTRRESFLRIEHITSGGDYWVVRDKQGTVSRYGFNADARVVHPTNGFPFAWHLDSVTDAHGNEIRYTYTQPSGTNLALLSAIAYAYRGGVPVGDLRTIEFVTEDRPDKPESYLAGFKTLLDRRLARIDVKVNGVLARRYDFAYTQSTDSGRSLLASVREIGSDGVTALPPTVFTYTDNTGNGGTRGWSDQGAAGWNLPGLLQFVETDKKDTGVRLADVNGDGLVDVVRSKKNVGRQVYLNNGTGFDAAASPAWTIPVDLVDDKGKDQGFAFLDLDRDGLLDLLQIRERDGTAGYQGTDRAAYLNNGSTWVSTPSWSNNIDLANHFVLRDGGSGSNPEGPTQPVDLNGDGRVDLLMAKFFIFIASEFTNRGYQRNNGAGFDTLQNDRYTICTANTPACRLDSIFVQDQFCLGGNGVSLCAHLRLGKRLFDLNGDGLTDLVTNFDSNVTGSTAVNAYLNDGTDFVRDDAWDVPPLIDFEKLNQGIPITHDQGVRIADVNGDGALDLVQARDENGTLILNVWINHQTTNGGSPWVPDAAWNVPADAVFVDKNSKDLGVRLSDVNGDGLPDILIAAAAGLKKTYLNQGTKPDLLNRIVSPLGATTSLDYVPSTLFDNTGGDGQPDLPTPVWVVSAITTDDGLGQAGSMATTTFGYAGGIFDGARREFRGFEMVSVTQADGSVVERHFHQADGLAGLEKSMVVMGPAPGGGLTPLRQEEAAYAFMSAADAAPTVVFADGTTGSLSPSDPTLAAFSDWKARFAGAPGAASARLALPVQKDATVFDPAAPAQAMSTRTLTEYDSRGNATAEKFLGDVTQAGGERFTFLEYATPADPTTNRFGLPSHVYVTPASGLFADRIAETEVLYDGAPTFGTLTTGDITALRRWLKDPLTSAESYVRTGFSYDAHGNVSQITADEGGLEIKRQITYGPAGAYATQVVEAAGTPEALTALFEYDPPGAPPGLGLLKRRTEPDGNVTDFTHDALGRPTEATAGGGLAQVKRSYDLGVFPAVILTQILESGTASAPTHTVQLFAYLDGFGRAVRTARPSDASDWILEDTFRDSLGRVSKAGFPFKATDPAPSLVPLDESKSGTAFTYDALGLPLTTTSPDEQGVLRTTAFTYLVGDLDGDGAVDQSRRRTDPAGKAQEVLVDARGNTQAMRDFDGATPQTTRYVYDLTDRLAGITDPEGHATSLTYDTLGRRRRLVDPDAGTWLYAYDAVGRMTARTDPRGNQLLFDFDALSRLSAKRLDLGGGASQTRATYTYDQGPNAQGRLSAIDDAVGQRTFQYDPLGRITQVGQTLFGHPFAEEATYNALGAITTLTLPTGEVVTRTYLDGFLKKVEGQDRYATDLQYDVFGGLLHAALGNGDTLDFSFHPNGRLSGIQSNGGQAQDLAYGYDPSGNIASVTDALDPSASRSFTYDGLDRLTAATGPSTSDTYTYSP